MIAEVTNVRNDRVEVSACTEDGAERCVYWATRSELPLDDEAAPDAAIAATLLPAMARQERLRVVQPVSSRLCANVPRLQDVFVTWSRHNEVMLTMVPAFRYVPLDVDTRADGPARSGRGTACFFTGGVDSLYTVIKCRSSIDALVFVHGFDIPLDRTAKHQQVTSKLREAARELRLPLLELETNVREFSDRHVGWLDAHGAALASVALLLGRQFGRVLVPATHTFATLFPLGSHPLTDPLWSTDRVELVHEGAEATRVEKLRVLSEHQVARESLRVCVNSDSERYNCGDCEKCIRTMVGVRVLGLAGRFPTLPFVGRPSLLRRITRPQVVGRGSTWGRFRTNWKPYLLEARPIGEAPALAGALLVSLVRAKLDKKVAVVRTAARRLLDRT